MTIQDSFIVRIYRRDREDPRLMVGLVEEVGSRRKRGFTTFDELREILLTPTGRHIQHKYMKDKRKHTPGGL